MIQKITSWKVNHLFPTVVLYSRKDNRLAITGLGSQAFDLSCHWRVPPANHSTSLKQLNPLCRASAHCMSLTSGVPPLRDARLPVWLTNVHGWDAFQWATLTGCLTATAWRSLQCRVPSPSIHGQLSGSPLPVVSSFSIAKGGGFHPSITFLAFPPLCSSNSTPPHCNF